MDFGLGYVADQLGLWIVIIHGDQGQDSHNPRIEKNRRSERVRGFPSTGKHPGGATFLDGRYLGRKNCLLPVSPG